MTIDTVKNIQALKAYPVGGPAPAPFTVVYVDGYYRAGDGGGGNFIFDPCSKTEEDLGINFYSDHIPDPNKEGRWVRQYYGHINAMYFGIVKYHIPLCDPDYPCDPEHPCEPCEPCDPVYQPPSGPWNSERLQRAINYSFSTSSNPMHSTAPGDLTIYFPAGSYWLDKTITLKEQTHIKGDDGTLLNMQFQNDYMFVIDKGPINRLYVENFVMNLGADHGPGSPPLTVGGFLFEAVVSDPKDPQSAGGLWSAVIKDIKIVNMAGHGIRMRGGDMTGHVGRKANQYIYIDNVWIERSGEKDKCCVKMTGEQVNISFMNCQFSIPYYEEQQRSDEGSNIWISSVATRPIPDMNAQIRFINCATGGGPGKAVLYAANIRNADNITFENCWFEDTEIAINIENSQAINVLNSRFANAAGHGNATSILGHDGDCIRVTDSFVTIERNFALISYPEDPKARPERFIRGIGNNNSINAKDNSFSHILTSNTFGITQYVNIDKIPTYYLTPPTPVTVDGIDTGGKKLVLVLTKPKEKKDIYRINSMIAAGESLFIRAEDGDIEIHAMDPVNELNGYNIYLGGLGSVVLHHGECATFMKLDGVNNQEYCQYQMTSKFP